MPMHLPPKRPRRAIVVSLGTTRIEYTVLRRSGQGWINEGCGARDYDEQEPTRALGGLDVLRGVHEDTALLVVLARELYDQHNAAYPKGMASEVQSALAYEFDELLPSTPVDTLHFHGGVQERADRLFVPVYSLDKARHEAYTQACGAERFKSFLILPDAVAFEHAMEASIMQVPQPSCSLLCRAGRAVSFYRIIDGRVAESFAALPGSGTLRSAAWACAAIGGAPMLIQSPDEDVPKGISDFPGAYQTLKLDEPLSLKFATALLDRDVINGFGPSLRVKPWRMGWKGWAVAAVLLLYVAFGCSQLIERRALDTALADQTAELAKLKTQWTPIQQRMRAVQLDPKDKEALRAYEAESVLPLSLLAVLTQKTSEHTWIRELRLRQGRLTLSGESFNVMEYQGTLAAIPGLSSVRFVSSVNKNQATGRDAFTIEASVDCARFRPGAKEGGRP